MCTREQKAAKQVEGFGLAFLEAQACGTVTIGTRQGGIVDAIEDNNGGFLIDRDDDASLTRQIEELVKSPSLCKEQGVMARQRIEKEATWQHYGQRVATLLNQYFGDKDESS
jgi:phosphatidylinositol alpha-1,6-mannosyltransferase